MAHMAAAPPLCASDMQSNLPASGDDNRKDHDGAAARSSRPASLGGKRRGRAEGAQPHNPPQRPAWTPPPSLLQREKHLAAGVAAGTSSISGNGKAHPAQQQQQQQHPPLTPMGVTTSRTSGLGNGAPTGSGAASGLGQGSTAGARSGSASNDHHRAALSASTSDVRQVGASTLGGREDEFRRRREEGENKSDDAGNGDEPDDDRGEDRAAVDSAAATAASGRNKTMGRQAATTTTSGGGGGCELTPPPTSSSRHSSAARGFGGDNNVLASPPYTTPYSESSSSYATAAEMHQAQGNGQIRRDGPLLPSVQGNGSISKMPEGRAEQEHPQRRRPTHRQEPASCGAPPSGEREIREATSRKDDAEEEGTSSSSSAAPAEPTSLASEHEPASHRPEAAALAAVEQEGPTKEAPGNQQESGHDDASDEAPPASAPKKTAAEAPEMRASSSLQASDRPSPAGRATQRGSSSSAVVHSTSSSAKTRLPETNGPLKKELEGDSLVRSRDDVVVARPTAGAYASTAAGRAAAVAAAMAPTKSRRDRDGSVSPVVAPKMTEDGHFLRPKGRGRKGMDWDERVGKWIPKTSSISPTASGTVTAISQPPPTLESPRESAAAACASLPSATGTAERSIDPLPEEANRDGSVSPVAAPKTTADAVVKHSSSSFATTRRPETTSGALPKDSSRAVPSDARPAAGAYASTEVGRAAALAAAAAAPSKRSDYPSTPARSSRGPDGSISPAADGLFQRLRRKGMEWDERVGRWIPTTKTASISSTASGTGTASIGTSEEVDGRYVRTDRQPPTLEAPRESAAACASLPSATGTAGRSTDSLSKESNAALRRDSKSAPPSSSLPPPKSSPTSMPIPSASTTQISVPTPAEAAAAAAAAALATAIAPRPAVRALDKPLKSSRETVASPKPAGKATSPKPYAAAAAAAAGATRPAVRAMDGPLKSPREPIATPKPPTDKASTAARTSAPLSSHSPRSIRQDSLQTVKRHLIQARDANNKSASRASPRPTAGSNTSPRPVAGSGTSPRPPPPRGQRSRSTSPGPLRKRAIVLPTHPDDGPPALPNLHDAVRSGEGVESSKGNSASSSSTSHPSRAAGAEESISTKSGETEKASSASMPREASTSDKAIASEKYTSRSSTLTLSKSSSKSPEAPPPTGASPALLPTSAFRKCVTSPHSSSDGGNTSPTQPMYGDDFDSSDDELDYGMELTGAPLVRRGQQREAQQSQIQQQQQSSSSSLDGRGRSSISSAHPAADARPSLATTSNFTTSHDSRSHPDLSNDTGTAPVTSFSLSRPSPMRPGREGVSVETTTGEMPSIEGSDSSFATDKRDSDSKKKGVHGGQESKGSQERRFEERGIRESQRVQLPHPGGGGGPGTSSNSASQHDGKGRGFAHSHPSFASPEDGEIVEGADLERSDPTSPFSDSSSSPSDGSIPKSHPLDLITLYTTVSLPPLGENGRIGLCYVTDSHTHSNSSLGSLPLITTVTRGSCFDAALPNDEENVAVWIRSVGGKDQAGGLHERLAKDLVDLQRIGRARVVDVELLVGRKLGDGGTRGDATTADTEAPAAATNSSQTSSNETEQQPPPSQNLLQSVPSVDDEDFFPNMPDDDEAAMLPLPQPRPGPGPVHPKAGIDKADAIDETAMVSNDALPEATGPEAEPAADRYPESPFADSSPKEWLCDKCSADFDTYEEAEKHELVCTGPPPTGGSASTVRTTQAPSTVPGDAREPTMDGASTFASTVGRESRCVDHDGNKDLQHQDLAESDEFAANNLGSNAASSPIVGPSASDFLTPNKALQLIERSKLRIVAGGECVSPPPASDLLTRNKALQLIERSKLRIVAGGECVSPPPAKSKRKSKKRAAEGGQGGKDGAKRRKQTKQSNAPAAVAATAPATTDAIPKIPTYETTVTLPPRGSRIGLSYTTEPGRFPLLRSTTPDSCFRALHPAISSLGNDDGGREADVWIISIDGKNLSSMSSVKFRDELKELQLVGRDNTVEVVFAVRGPSYLLGHVPAAATASRATLRTSFPGDGSNKENNESGGADVSTEEDTMGRSACAAVDENGPGTIISPNKASAANALLGLAISPNMSSSNEVPIAAGLTPPATNSRAIALEGQGDADQEVGNVSEGDTAATTSACSAPKQQSEKSVSAAPSANASGIASDAIDKSPSEGIDTLTRTLTMKKTQEVEEEEGPKKPAQLSILEEARIQCDADAAAAAADADADADPRRDHINGSRLGGIRSSRSPRPHRAPPKYALLAPRPVSNQEVGNVSEGDTAATTSACSDPKQQSEKSASAAPSANASAAGIVFDSDDKSTFKATDTPTSPKKSARLSILEEARILAEETRKSLGNKSIEECTTDAKERARKPVDGGDEADAFKSAEATERIGCKKQHCAGSKAASIAGMLDQFDALSDEEFLPNVSAEEGAAAPMDESLVPDEAVAATVPAYSASASSPNAALAPGATTTTMTTMTTTTASVMDVEGNSKLRKDKNIKARDKNADPGDREGGKENIKDYASPESSADVSASDGLLTETAEPSSPADGKADGDCSSSPEAPAPPTATSSNLEQSAEAAAKRPSPQEVDPVHSDGENPRQDANTQGVATNSLVTAPARWFVFRKTVPSVYYRRSELSEPDRQEVRILSHDVIQRTIDALVATATDGKDGNNDDNNGSVASDILRVELKATNDIGNHNSISPSGITASGVGKERDWLIAASRTPSLAQKALQTLGRHIMNVVQFETMRAMLFSGSTVEVTLDLTEETMMDQQRRRHCEGGVDGQDANNAAPAKTIRGGLGCVLQAITGGSDGGTSSETPYGVLTARPRPGSVLDVVIGREIYGASPVVIARVNGRTVVRPQDVISIWREATTKNRSSSSISCSSQDENDNRLTLCLRLKDISVVKLVRKLEYIVDGSIRKIDGSVVELSQPEEDGTDDEARDMPSPSPPSQADAGADTTLKHTNAVSCLSRLPRKKATPRRGSSVSVEDSPTRTIHPKNESAIRKDSSRVSADAPSDAAAAITASLLPHTAANQEGSAVLSKDDVARPMASSYSSTAAERAAAAAAAVLKGSAQFKYSEAGVESRKNPDGSIVPVKAALKTADGLFVRPPGRGRKGMDWDDRVGRWVPKSSSPEEEESPQPKSSGAEDAIAAQKRRDACLPSEGQGREDDVGRICMGELRKVERPAIDILLNPSLRDCTKYSDKDEPSPSIEIAAAKMSLDLSPTPRHNSAASANTTKRISFHGEVGFKSKQRTPTACVSHIDGLPIENSRSQHNGRGSQFRSRQLAPAFAANKKKGEANTASHSFIEVYHSNTCCTVCKSRKTKILFCQHCGICRDCSRKNACPDAHKTNYKGKTVTRFNQAKLVGRRYQDALKMAFGLTKVSTIEYDVTDDTFENSMEVTAALRKVENRCNVNVDPSLTAVRALLEHDKTLVDFPLESSPDSSDEHVGQTALFAAVLLLDHDAVLSLLLNGANPRQRDNKKKRPLDYAKLFHRACVTDIQKLAAESSQPRSLLEEKEKSLQDWKLKYNILEIFLDAERFADDCRAVRSWSTVEISLKGLTDLKLSDEGGSEQPGSDEYFCQVSWGGKEKPYVTKKAPLIANNTVDWSKSRRYQFRINCDLDWTFKQKEMKFEVFKGKPGRDPVLLSTVVEVGENVNAAASETEKVGSFPLMQTEFLQSGSLHVGIQRLYDPSYEREKTLAHSEQLGKIIDRLEGVQKALRRRDQATRMANHIGAMHCAVLLHNTEMVKRLLSLGLGSAREYGGKSTSSPLDVAQSFSEPSKAIQEILVMFGIKMPPQQQPAGGLRQHQEEDFTTSNLPALEKPKFMEPDHSIRCRFFNSFTSNFKGCKFGGGCNYVHVYEPRSITHGRVPAGDALCEAYRANFDVPLRQGCCRVQHQRSNDGRMWYTAALACPVERTIYYAAGGEHGSKHPLQNLWWYPEERDAIAAVAVVVLDAFHFRGLSCSWGVGSAAPPSSGMPSTVIHGPSRSIKRSREEGNTGSNKRMHVERPDVFRGQTSLSVPVEVEKNDEDSVSNLSDPTEGGHSPRRSEASLIDNRSMRSSDMPMIPTRNPREWMLMHPKRFLCYKYRDRGYEGCALGNRCKFAHVFRPATVPTSHVPEAGELSHAYQGIFGVTLYDGHYRRLSERSRGGRIMFTAALQCLAEETWYLAEGGKGCRSSDSLWWYLSESDAIAAVDAVVLNAWRDRGML